MTGFDVETENFYQLRGQYYLGDGLYVWEDVDAQAETLDDCLGHKESAILNSPEYVDFMVEYRVVTTILVMPPENGIESDMER
jgi:hypothetical protein